MNSIDLSVISSPKEDTEIKQKESHCDKIYQGMISDYILHTHNNSSGCFGCTVDQIYKVQFDQRKIVEIKSKGILNENYCEISPDISYPISQGDSVLVKCGDGVEIAEVIECGDLVRLKRRKLGLFDESLPMVVRKIGRNDSDKIQRNRNDEIKAEPVFKELVGKYKLTMKLVDIHYQFDRKKLYFFYTSDGRVDFRQLARDLAGIYKTRIELRQIGVRDEAKRMGGMGLCGREFCCSSFLQDFRHISAQEAIGGNNSANLSKMSGPCGKLRCCITFEQKN